MCSSRLQRPTKYGLGRGVDTPRKSRDRGQERSQPTNQAGYIMVESQLTASNVAQHHDNMKDTIAGFLKGDVSPMKQNAEE
jgi:hypothetical protein